MNERDSEALAAQLARAGFRCDATEEEADIFILNSCSVRDQAERNAIGKLQRLIYMKKFRPLLVGVTGCMAQSLGEKLFKQLPGLDFVIGTQELHRIAEILEKLLEHEGPFLCLDRSPAGPSEIHLSDHIQPYQSSAFVAISTGCNMNCSYCIVPQTRGPEVSRSQEAILNEVSSLAAGGVREVMLLGQIVNQYAVRSQPFRQGKSPFVQLLERIHGIDGIERIRFTSPHPCGFRQDLIDAFRTLPKVCPAVHLPLQSGSNCVLRAMRRPYRREKFFSIVENLRAFDPLFSISTDIIVGFPGETEEDFQETVTLFDQVGFDMAFIFKYSPRRSTPAADMSDQVPEKIKRTRNQLLLDQLASSSLRRNQLHVGSEQVVLVEAISKKNPSQLYGRTRYHKKVFFEGQPSLIGRFVLVAIEKAYTSCLLGRAVGFPEENREILRSL